MAEHLRDDLDRHSGTQRQSRERVAEVVQAYLREARLLHESLESAGTKPRDAPTSRLRDEDESRLLS